jgi:hypothetical protein
VTVSLLAMVAETLLREASFLVLVWELASESGVAWALVEVFAASEESVLAEV